MYAVIKTGGKQTRVEEGQRIDVELLASGDDGAVSFAPILIVDGETTIATPSALAGAVVSGKVVGESKGPKITGFTYKNKTNSSRRWGHRQHYTTVEITAISRG